MRSNSGTKEVHAGWRGDITPGTAIAALAIIVFGIPAAFVLVVLALGTLIGAIVW